MNYINMHDPLACTIDRSRKCNLLRDQSSHAYRYMHIYLAGSWLRAIYALTWAVVHGRHGPYICTYEYICDSLHACNAHCLHQKRVISARWIQMGSVFDLKSKFGDRCTSITINLYIFTHDHACMKTTSICLRKFHDTLLIETIYRFGCLLINALFRFVNTCFDRSMHAIMQMHSHIGTYMFIYVFIQVHVHIWACSQGDRVSRLLRMHGITACTACTLAPVARPRICTCIHMHACPGHKLIYGISIHTRARNHACTTHSHSPACHYW